MQNLLERAKHPEKHRETARKYNEANKAHIRELKRKHQAENPEKYERALRKYRKAHREEFNAKARERHNRNLEHYREIGRNSYETMPTSVENILSNTTKIILKSPLPQPIIAVL